MCWYTRGGGGCVDVPGGVGCWYTRGDGGCLVVPGGVGCVGILEVVEDVLMYRVV